MVRYNIYFLQAESDCISQRLKHVNWPFTSLVHSLATIRLGIDCRGVSEDRSLRLITSFVCAIIKFKASLTF